jgi:hypothetical protein
LPRCDIRSAGSVLLDSGISARPIAKIITS